MIRNMLLSPLQRFVKTGSTAGMLLFGATVIALIWANTPYVHYYESLLQLELGVSFETFAVRKPLILWINDGLMAIFFFLIGLELKRELMVGEINTLKKAAFPLLAALGGVVIPIALYYFLNQDPNTARGWGIPMATDIAFALAILTLLGDRVPLSLKVFLTAFAIIDDIAAVIVIAVFYSSNVQVDLLLYGLAVIALLALYYRVSGYSIIPGLVLAVVTWFLFLKSGIHPTIAGVLLAFTIPLRRTLNLREFADRVRVVSTEIYAKATDDADDDSDKHILTEEEVEAIDYLDDLTDEAVSPLQHLEHKLHGMTAYLILPVFAFANAGVTITADYPYDFDLIRNIALSLFVGKLLGVVLFAYVGLKLNLAALPGDLTFRHIIGAAAIAGVGFTMSIFIDYLAFAGNERSIVSAKIGVIIGSFVSGLVGYLILRTVARKGRASGEARTIAQ
jgi:NhaA family Na+:H+ antiporter